MKTRSWTDGMMSTAVAIVALTVTLFAPAAPSAAQPTSMHENSLVGGNPHHRPAAEHATESHGHHDGERDHHSSHHFGRRPNAIYYIYPYNGWIYRYYAVPTYPAPTYWYYCPSYGAYYPYVTSCPESWVPVPAS
jgi:hypothetical protein